MTGREPMVASALSIALRFAIAIIAGMAVAVAIVGFWRPV